jgi:hypothetical protein
MKLVKTPFATLPLLAIDSEAENRRNELVQSALAITKITCADENDQARNVAVEIRTHLKDVEATRTQLTKPLLDGQRMLKLMADDHGAPLKTVLERLERLATAFAVSERDKAAAEDKARLELAAEAKTEADFQSVMAEPIAERAVAQGQQLRKILRWECTDILALVKARPDLCKIEPKGSAIQATCIPEMPNVPPGLRLFWDEKAVFTTR